VLWLSRCLSCWSPCRRPPGPPRVERRGRDPRGRREAARDDDGLPRRGAGVHERPQPISVFLSLDGQWRFHLSPRPRERPRDFFRPGFDDSTWPRIPVPANWQMHGFDRPIYRNIDYPWDQDPKAPPRVPVDDNPGRLVSHHVHRAAGVGRTPRAAALRGRRLGLLRLGQRHARGLQRGQPHAGRVRRDAAPPRG